MAIKKDYRKIKCGSLKVFSSNKTVDNDYKNKDWKNEAQVVTYPARHFCALSGVYFLKVVIKPPAKACYAEQKDHQCSDREDQVTY